MIEIENLSLSFGDRRALDDVSFHVPKGAVTGFIGENGAGKTSTFRVLTTWLLPDPETVSVRVGGIDLFKDLMPLVLGWEFFPNSWHCRVSFESMNI
ncbi:MAG: ATP-binding cassette domain-containing protein [Planctomycetota bacterium]|nr:ATP-binding cassette domain-containing protein [Planctomycetota bacterium]